MNPNEALRRVGGFHKPGAWEYIPGFIARPVIKVVKDIAGTNRARRRNSILRRSVRFVRDEYHKTLATILLGASSSSGLSEDEKMDILKTANFNSALRDQVDDYKRDCERIAEERDELREALFKRELDDLVKEGGFKNRSLMVYNLGDILYTTPEFDKQFGGNRRELGYNMWKYEEMNEKLKNGKVAEIEYNGKVLKFVPCRESGNRSLAVAYVVDSGHKKKRLHAIRAARAISDYLKNVDLGMMGTELKERAVAEEVENERRRS